MPTHPSLPRKIAAFAVIGLMGLTLGLVSEYYDQLYVARFESAEHTRDHTPRVITLNPEAIAAQAAVVYDPQTGTVLFAKNSETQLPLASLTKLATARAVLSSTNRNQIVIIKTEDLQEEGSAGLRAGDVWRLSDLVAFGLTTSSNDAMAAVAGALSPTVAVARMNEDARKNNMPQSYYLNPTGLDISSSTAGAYGSALDVARLVDALLREYPSVFEATTHMPKASGDSGVGAEPTTAPIWSVPGLIAAKTGYTELAGGNLAVAVDLGLGEPIIAVVLGSTKEGRFEDIKTLVEAARNSKEQ